jgi:hypothetical protein
MGGSGVLATVSLLGLRFRLTLTAMIEYWTKVAAFAQIGQVVVLIVTARFVWLYLKATEELSRTAQRQVQISQRQVAAALEQIEGQILPAIAIVHNGSVDSSPAMENIGNGPAMDVSWSLIDSPFSGTISFLRPGESRSLNLEGEKPLFNAGIASQAAGRPAIIRIECKYRSVSGGNHFSNSLYDINSSQFVTTFRHG